MGIALAEAEGKLADLVERARQGETIDITEGGKPVAHLAPAAPKPARAREPIDFERLRAFTASLTPDPEPMETWILKFRDNKRRDALAKRTLRRDGYRVVTVWECQIDRVRSKLSKILESRSIDTR